MKKLSCFLCAVVNLRFNSSHGSLPGELWLVLSAEKTEKKRTSQGGQSNLTELLSSCQLPGDRPSPPWHQCSVEDWGGVREGLTMSSWHMFRASQLQWWGHWGDCGIRKPSTVCSPRSTIRKEIIGEKNTGSRRSYSEWVQATISLVPTCQLTRQERYNNGNPKLLAVFHAEVWCGVLLIRLWSG